MTRLLHRIGPALGGTALLLILHLAAFSASAEDLASKPVAQIEKCIRDSAPADSSVQTIALTTVDRLGGETRRMAKVFWQRDEDDHSNILLRFSDPIEMRGSALLILERERGNHLYMYVPEMRRTVRVTGRTMAHSMFGTDFSYDDYERLYGLSRDAESAVAGEAEVNGRKVWVVESRPDPESGSMHAKVISRIDQERCVPVLVEFLDRTDTVRKRLELDPSAVRQEGDAWVPTLVMMRDLRDRTHTILEVKEVAVNQEIPRRTFSERELPEEH